MLFAVAFAPPSGLRSLPYGRSRIHSHSSWIFLSEICHTPVLQKIHQIRSPYEILLQLCASFPKEILFPLMRADLSRHKLRIRRIRQSKFRPVYTRAELVGDLASPSPSLLPPYGKKIKPAGSLYFMPKAWLTLYEVYMTLFPILKELSYK